MKFILLLFAPFVFFNCFSQQVSFTNVILSNHENTLKNNDSIVGKGSRMLTISLASGPYNFVEAEFSVTVKRGKASIFTMSSKGKEISLVNLGVYAKSGDILYIEIKKLKTSDPGIILKPSNGIFKIHLK